MFQYTKRYICDQMEVIIIFMILSIGHSLLERHLTLHILGIWNAIHFCRHRYCTIESYNTGQQVNVTTVLWKGSELWNSVGAGLLEMGRGCEGLLSWGPHKGKQRIESSYFRSRVWELVLGKGCERSLWAAWILTYEQALKVVIRGLTVTHQNGFLHPHYQQPFTGEQSRSHQSGRGLELMDACFFPPSKWDWVLSWGTTPWLLDAFKAMRLLPFSCCLCHKCLSHKGP